MLDQQLAAYHAENPDLQGIGREKLRLLMQPRLPAAEFVAAIQKIAASGQIVLDGSFVRLATHTVRLTPKDEDLTALETLGRAAARRRSPLPSAPRSRHRNRNLTRGTRRPPAFQTGRASGMDG